MATAVGSLQPHIGCFETLQLALTQCVWQALRGKHVRFALPSASDTSAESGLNKLFSTAEPLRTFLRLAATWVHLHRVQFQVEHLAGKKNACCDLCLFGVQQCFHARLCFEQVHRAALVQVTHEYTQTPVTR